jgi:hypothetical protein
MTLAAWARAQTWSGAGGVAAVQEDRPQAEV